MILLLVSQKKFHNGFFNPSRVDESQKLDSDNALDAQLIHD